ncbi:MAG: M3 family metallopeptidase [Bacteroidales bacterium]
MKKLLSLFTVVLFTAGFCSAQTSSLKKMENPLLAPFNTPFEVPPFNEIELEHFIPAIEEGIKQQLNEIEAITSNLEKPDFNNTILAYDLSGEILSKVNGIFSPLSSANTNDSMQALDRRITPMMTAHRNNISMNPALFARIKDVYNNRKKLSLNAEQIRVTEKFYEDFVRNGANLTAEGQEKLKTINLELSKLSLQYGENVLAETNKNFRLIVETKADLAGLPEDVIARASEDAKKAGQTGTWVFTLSKPSLLPFLQFADSRALREKLYRAYFMRGDNDNSSDNKEIIKKIVSLRDQKAKLLGYRNWGEYIIDVNMAETPAAVYEFLNKLWKPALQMAKKDVEAMQAIIDKEGGNFKLESWDWWYYSEKLRKEKFSLDEEEIKPYFSLENAKNGIFYVTEKLYGIKFIKRPDLPVYHPEAEAYEVQEANGSHLGVLYMDFHPRDGKRAGAWSTAFRNAHYKDGKRVTRVGTIVMNFTRPAGATPALLSFDEVSTFFHEFGHALHGLFADGPYRRTAGNVQRDFVELPSQIMENWAAEPEVMKVYAKHYQTGETIPDALIEKLEKSSTFNQGFITGEYIAASLLDLDYHTTAEPEITDIRVFENNSMRKAGIISEFTPRYRSTYFSHIFSGGYSAGYYVYLWAAVLDADAFDAFKQSGDIFNKELAAKFRHLLARCGSDEGMNIYRNFRGKDPSPDPLLLKRGLK